MNRFNGKKFISVSLALISCVACEKGLDDEGSIYESSPIATITELKNFTVSINTAQLSEKDKVPTDSYDENYSFYIENGFKETNVTKITFNGSSAYVSGQVKGDTIAVDNGNVDAHIHSKGLTLQINGETSNGSLKIYSANRFCLKLCSASVTNPAGSAINIQKGDCYIVLDGTSTLSDGMDANYIHQEGEDEKAVLFSNDNISFSGKGKLTVTACNTLGKECISSDDMLLVRPNTNIQLISKAQAGHGIKTKDGFVLKGGVLNIETSADGRKGISSDGNITIDGGRTTIISHGGIDSLDKSDPVGCAAIKCDSILTINGGQLHIKSTGQGGKGLSADKCINISGGSTYIITEGEVYGISDSQKGGGFPIDFNGMDHNPEEFKEPRPESEAEPRPGAETEPTISVSAKGIRCDGDINISGGNVFIRTTGSNAEGIESKATLTFSGGNTAVYTFDDGFNAKTINISGGRTFAMCSGECDGIDSNGSMNVTGGLMIGVGGSKITNDGIDFKDTLAVSNATLIGIAVQGLGEGKIQGHYVKTNVSGVEGNYVALCHSRTLLATFYLPKLYSSGTLLLSSPTLTSGQYILKTGASPSIGSLWMNYADKPENLMWSTYHSVSSE